MILLVLFGVGMAFFGLFMILKPAQFSESIVQFSEKPWFHVFEVISRLVLGLAFVFFADQTAYPKFVLGLGFVLCLASIILVLLGGKRHRQFAVFISGYLKSKFRYIGFFAFGLGMTIVVFGLTGINI